MNCKYHEYPDNVDNDELGIRATQMFIPGARPTKHISIEFEMRWKFKTL